MAKKAGIGNALGKGLGKGLGSLIPSDETVDEEQTEIKDKKPGRKPKSATSVTGNRVSKKGESDIISKQDEKKNGDFQDVDSVNNRKGQTAGEQSLKITQIEPNKSQPRKDFDIEALKELSESIRQFGLLQPILVRKKDDKYYEIIAGERRWRAAKLAGLKEVPVIIRDFTTEQVMEAALIENIQRKDLNPIEEALAFSNLINEYTLTQEELAAKVSKSRAQISNTMRLLKLNANVQQMLIADEISMGHARAILAINDEEIQMEVAKYVINNDLSVRETEKYIKDILEPRQTVQKPAAVNPAGLLVYRDMEKKMSNCLGSKVGIKTRDGKKGRIEIEYSSQEELERLFDKLSI